jgi:hypothetical protein
MYDSSSPYFQSELDYRADRIRNATAVNRRRRRLTRTRRHAEAGHAH